MVPVESAIAIRQQAQPRIAELQARPRIQSGSTGAILRQELSTGVGSTKHLQKAQEVIAGVRRLIKSGQLDEGDLQIAKEVYNNLVNNLTFNK